MKKLLAILVLALLAVAMPSSPAWSYGEPTGPNRVALGGDAEYTFENIPADVLELQVSIDGPGDAVLAGLVSRTYAVTFGYVDVRIAFPVTGSYSITGTGSGPRSGSFTHVIAVDVVVAPDDADEIAASGADVSWMLAIAVGTLVVGVALTVLVATQRRRHRAAARDAERERDSMLV